MRSGLEAPHGIAEFARERCLGFSMHFHCGEYHVSFAELFRETGAPSLYVASDEHLEVAVARLVRLAQHHPHVESG